MEILSRMNWDTKGIFLVLFFSCFLFLSFSCAHRPEPHENPVFLKNIDPVAASALIKKNRGNTDFVILDVRSPEAFQKRHIPGAVNVSYHSDGFRQAIDALDRDKTYVVYCRTGRRSGETFEMMKTMGFKTVYRISGGMERWLAHDLPLVP